jgi:hypothetical protein
MAETSLIPAERIEKAIYILRSQRVLLDSDLAMLYGVTTTRLNEQVKRNIDRFPADFMFQLTKEEWDTLMSQLATSKGGGCSRIKSLKAFVSSRKSIKVFRHRTRRHHEREAGLRQ